jgi:valyl-tRNA synthetase
VAGEVGERLAGFRFDEACNRLYHFFWGDLCDWYIELSKPALMAPAESASRPRVGEVLLTVLDRSLRLLHPIMPFLTEEVWQRLPGHEAIHPETICLAPYPEREPAWEEAGKDTEAGMEALMQVVTRVRAFRAELNLPPKAGIDLTLQANGEIASFLRDQQALLGFLCRADGVTLAAPREGARRDLVAGVEIGVAASASAETAEGLGAAERERLEKEAARLGEEIARAEERLGNETFVSKAPPQVVQGNRKKLAELKERRERILETLQKDA